MSSYTVAMRLVISILLSLVLSLPAQAGSSSLIFGVPENTDPSLALKILEIVYARLDIEITPLPLPGRRSLMEAQLGNSDGEVGRVASIESHHPELIRILVPVDTFKGVGLTMNPSIRIRTLKDLTELRVGILSGIKFAEAITKNTPSLTASQSWDKLFQLLRHNRLDVVIAAHGEWDKQRVKAGFENLLTQDLPIPPICLYHYLHIRHRDIAPRVTRIMEEMVRNGEIETLAPQSKADTMGLCEPPRTN